MKKLTILTALAVMVSVPFALAGEGGKGHGKHGGKMFERQDTNGDGVISKDEFLASAEKKFDKMDADGNGSVSKDEAKAHHSKMKDKWKAMKEKRDSKSAE